MLEHQGKRSQVSFVSSLQLEAGSLTLSQALPRVLNKSHVCNAWHLSSKNLIPDQLQQAPLPSDRYSPHPTSMYQP